MSAPFLQSFVTTVVSYEERDGAALVRRVHGTAALIGPSGEFITAAHVLREAESFCRDGTLRIGVSPSILHADGSAGSAIAPIEVSEDAPSPYDVAVFKTPYRAKTPFRISRIDVDVWKDCATLGYPSQTVMPVGGIIELQARALKGYIQRIVPAGRAERPGHPNSFEVSFVITRGMSGSPLFIYQGDTDALIGVCVGSIRSEIVATDIELPVPGQNAVRIEEYGWAHDVRGLSEWKPKIFDRSIGLLNS